MKKIISIAVAVCSVAVFSGCMKKEVVKRESAINSSGTVSLILPADASSKDKSPSEVVNSVLKKNTESYRYGSQRQYNSSSKISFSGDKFSFEKTNCLYDSYSGRCNQFSWARSTMTGTLSSVGSNANSQTIVFKPMGISDEYVDDGYKIKLSYKNIIEFYSDVNTPEKFEVDSQYPADSVYANFKRLAKSYNSKEQKIDGVSYKDQFYLTVDKTEVKFVVNSYPYRQGSKVIVTAWLSPIVNGNTVDFVTLKAKFKEKITSIVNS